MTARLDVRCHDLTICYHRRPAIHHLDACFSCGSLVAVVGPNGAGKSTLLQGMLGWLPWTSGSVTVDGVRSDRCRGRISYLAQRRTQDLDFPADVTGVVAMGRYADRGLLPGFAEADHRAVAEAIAIMGLEAVAHRPLAQLSGGQQQRAFVARALATGADVLLLDEPLTGLDAPSCRELLTRLRTWAERDRLVIAVIHDLHAVRAWCTHALLLDRRTIACGPVGEVMTDANLATCFGSAGGHT